MVHFFLSIAKVSLQSWFFTFAYVLQCTLYICINTRDKLIAKVCSVEGQLSQSQVWGNCLFLFHCNLMIDSFGIRSILFLTTIISSFREQLAFFASMGVFFTFPPFYPILFIIICFSSSHYFSLNRFVVFLNRSSIFSYLDLSSMIVLGHSRKSEHPPKEAGCGWRSVLCYYIGSGRNIQVHVWRLCTLSFLHGR